MTIQEDFEKLALENEYDITSLSPDGGYANIDTHNARLWFQDGVQAAQADQAATIAQLELDNEKMREALSNIDLRAIAKKVVNDATSRFVTMKPMYDSIDLGVTLVNQLVESQQAEITRLKKQNDVMREALVLALGCIDIGSWIADGDMKLAVDAYNKAKEALGEGETK